MKLRISGIVSESIVDGPGFRYTLFVQGCPHNCPGCHNPQTHDFAGGYDRNIDDILSEVLENPLLDGVTFSGGEPMCQAGPLADLAEKIHAAGLDVICYSGYTIEYLMANSTEDNNYLKLLSQIDYLIDGPFIMALKSYDCRFRGSTNQRIIDVKKSFEAGAAVEANI